MNIPFAYGKVVSGEFFTDREKEVIDISNYVASKTNIIIIAPRRWGKSSLIRKVAQEHSGDQKTRFAFIDMFAIRSEKDFYEVFSKEVLKAASSKWEERMELAVAVFKKLVPRFSVGADPNTEFSLQLDWDEVEKHSDEVLNLPETLSERKKIRIVVCIDEFQNANFLPDSAGFQKKLRASWQHFKHCSFIIYGSRRHMLMEIFNHPSMPFFKFGALLHLGKIPKHHWVSFISGHFLQTGKQIDPELCGLIIDKAENHPATVQQIAQAAWIMTKHVCSRENVDEAVEHTLLQMGPLFENIMNSLTGNQINLLKAITDEVKELTSKDTLKKYNLGTSAGVLRSRASLEQKEIIDFFGPKPEFEDPLFKLWFSAFHKSS